jgi:hypothetical protein
MDWLSGKTNKPNEIFKRALDVLAADGKIQTRDNGNLHKNLLSKPDSPSTARAMGRNGDGDGEDEDDRPDALRRICREVQRHVMPHAR